MQLYWMLGIVVSLPMVGSNLEALRIDCQYELIMEKMRKSLTNIVVYSMRDNMTDVGSSAGGSSREHNAIASIR